MSEDHTEKTVMPDIVRHLLDTVPVSPLSPGIIDYNQPEWLAEFNRRGERIAVLESERDRLREALVKLKECLEGYFGKTEKDFFEDCYEDSGELYFADVYNVAVNALKKVKGGEALK